MSPRRNRPAATSDIKDEQLPDRKQPREPRAPGAARHVLVLEDRYDVRTRSLKRGREPEEQTCQHCQDRSEDEHPAVDGDFLVDRDRKGQIRGSQGREQPEGQQHAEDVTQER